MTDNSAPGELDLVRLFVNTRNIEEGTDSIDSPSGLIAWLAGAGLIAEGARATAADVRRAAGVREAMRDMLLANNGDPADTAAAAATLTDAARASRFSLTFTPEGAISRPEAAGVSGALGRILAVAAAAMSDGTWARLKACASDECQWAFYDHARNRSGRWCDMAVCGNRMKARTYRARHA